MFTMIPKIPRETVVRAVSVILRAPSLFIAEAWFRTDPRSVQQLVHREKGDVETAQEVIVLTAYYAVILFAIALAILPLRKLVNFYMYILSTALLLVAHYASFFYVEAEKNSGYAGSVFDKDECIRRIGIHLVAQGTISAVIAYLINLRQWTKLTLLIYTSPMFARLLNYPLEDLHRVHNFASIFALLVVAFFLFQRVPVVLDIVMRGINQLTIAVQLYGWIPFLIAMWFKILLPFQLLVFWLVLFLVQLWRYVSVHNHPLLAEGWVVVILASTAECCVTPVSLIGVCVAVSYLSYVILSLTRFYLQGETAFLQDPHVMQRGWTEGFTMLLLALQTGITELKSTQRAFLMSIVLFIVLSSLIQSMYEIVDPILLALGASQNRSIWKHLRAVFLCTVLWMLPLYMSKTICYYFDLDFWLLAVISSCVLTSVQVMGSLVVYALFIYDGLREEPWEILDDVVYYAKATTRVMEFIVALFFVFYGVKESLVGEWSWVNTSIQIVHCYVNVWQRLQAGWASYLRRRDAVNKIQSLPVASEEQLANHNDVCAICYQEMKSACITRCNHLFHTVCLRKWLYVQETCPMCHQPVNSSKEDDLPSHAETSTNETQTDSQPAGEGAAYQPSQTPNVGGTSIEKADTVRTDADLESKKTTMGSENGDGISLFPGVQPQKVEVDRMEESMGSSTCQDFVIVNNEGPESSPSTVTQSDARAVTGS